jgi:hypothetical protein
MIEKKSKIFFIILFMVIIISVIITFNRYMINKDFDTITDEDIFNSYLLDNS